MSVGEEGRSHLVNRFLLKDELHTLWRPFSDCYFLHFAAQLFMPRLERVSAGRKIFYFEAAALVRYSEVWIL